jgi:hypothetical protein
MAQEKTQSCFMDRYYRRVLHPVIIIVARIVKPSGLHTIYSADNFWNALWKSSWESMAIFLLPLGVILLTSLITQIEYKNNTWKQLHTLPLTLTTVFFSKLTIIVVMLLQFFILFNIGIYLSAIIPYMVINDVPYPKSPIPYLVFLKENVLFFICCLPIIALQYLISLKYKNFLVPVGAGFNILGRVLLIGAFLGSTDISYSLNVLHVQLFERPQLNTKACLFPL